MIWVYYLGLLSAIAFIAIGATYLVMAKEWAHRAVQGKKLAGFEMKNAEDEESQRIAKEGRKYLIFGGLMLFISLLPFSR